MRETRMNTARCYHLLSLGVAPVQFVERNGMEEVVGSIPTRSTKPLNKLDRTNVLRVVVCVVAPPST